MPELGLNAAFVVLGVVVARVTVEAVAMMAQKKRPLRARVPLGDELARNRHWVCWRGNDPIGPVRLGHYIRLSPSAVLAGLDPSRSDMTSSSADGIARDPATTWIPNS